MIDTPGLNQEGNNQILPIFTTLVIFSSKCRWGWEARNKTWKKTAPSWMPCAVMRFQCHQRKMTLYSSKSQITPVLLQIHLCNWAHKPTNGLTSMASIRLCSCENFVILARWKSCWMRHSWENYYQESVKLHCRFYQWLVLLEGRGVIYQHYR